MSSLAEHLEAALHEGDAARVNPLLKVEKAFEPIFAALPKNKYGNLNHQAFTYAVHRYFATAWGMHINGMGVEAQGDQAQDALSVNASVVNDVNIQKAPAMVEALLEQRGHKRGLSLEDAAAMISTLIHLAFEDNRRLLALAYEANGFSVSQNLDYAQVEEVFLTFAVLGRDGMNGQGGDLLNKHNIELLKKHRRSNKSMKHRMSFMMDRVGAWVYTNRGRINPFVPPTFSFDAVVSILQDSLVPYANFQNLDCIDMKSFMSSLDPKGSGRVPLATFYEQPIDRSYRFSEPLDYLARIGALDMSNPEAPGVVISNYVLGPANCYRSSALYTHCCLSECEVLMADLESTMKSPHAPPGLLLEHVSNFSTTTVDGPRELPSGLVSKLDWVAQRHGGKVPLHGRLFAQWLHFAFPAECPYPTGKSTQAAPEVLQEHVTALSAPIEPSLGAWTDEEVLLEVDTRDTGRGPLRELASWVFGILAVGCVLRILFNDAQAARKKLRCIFDEDHHLKLPTRRDD